MCVFNAHQHTIFKMWTKSHTSFILEVISLNSRALKILKNFSVIIIVLVLAWITTYLIVLLLWETAHKSRNAYYKML